MPTATRGRDRMVDKQVFTMTSGVPYRRENPKFKIQFKKEIHSMRHGGVESRAAQPLLCVFQDRCRFP